MRLSLLRVVTLGTVAIFFGNVEASDESSTISNDDLKPTPPSGDSTPRQTGETRDVVAMVLEDDKFICLGAIINQQWILTAASCLNNTSDHYKVRTARPAPNRHASIANVQLIYQHWNFNLSTHEYDFAMLGLETNLVFDDLTGPVNLPRQGQSFRRFLIADVFEYAIAAKTSVLHQKEANILPMERCQQRCTDADTEEIFCVEYSDHSVLHFGDSGGPVMVDRELIGVMSKRCGTYKGNVISIVNNVSAVKNWIIEQINAHAWRLGLVLK